MKTLVLIRMVIFFSIFIFGIYMVTKDMAKFDEAKERCEAIKADTIERFGYQALVRAHQEHACEGGLFG
jgi:uncharacterized protein YpmB